MKLRRLATLALVGGLGCTPASERAAEGPLAQGRTYTAWLYGREYEKLWERFSPEMRQSFGSTADLADFAGGAIARLGSERATVKEDVVPESSDQVYSRLARFEHAPEPMLIQWTLTRDGAVTGLVVRPVPDSTSAGGAP